MCFLLHLKINFGNSQHRKRNGICNPRHTFNFNWNLLADKFTDNASTIL